MPNHANRTADDIRAIRQSLINIVEIFVKVLDRACLDADGTSVRQRGSAAMASRSGNGRRMRSVRLSPARRAALRLQGEYMGRIRNLRPTEKARVKALRARKGIPAAIRLAARLAR